MKIFSDYKKKFLPIYKDYSINILSQIINIIFSIFPVLLISNLLGPEAKGIVTMFFVIVGYFQIFGGLGISGSAIYFVANDNDNVRKQEITGEILFISFILGILTAIIYIPLASIYFVSSDIDSFFLFLFSGSIITFISITNNISQHLFIGAKNFINFALISNAPLVVSSITISVFIFFYKDVNTVIICYSSAYIISFILSCTIHLYNNINFTFRLSKRNVKKYFNYGLKSYFGRVLWRVWDKIDYIFIVYFLSVSSVGIYSISYMFSETIVLFATTVTTVITAYVASRKNLNEDKIIFKTLRYIVILMILYSLLLFITSSFLVKFLFNSDFASAILPLQFLIPGMVFLALGKIISSYLAGIGKPGLQSIAIICAFIISIAGNSLLIPTLGIIGASIATSISFFIYFIIVSFLFIRNTEKNIKNILFEI